MNTSWLIYLNLEKELIDCFNYVYFSDNDNQQKVYSNKFGDILLRSSIEVETILKELYRRNGGQKSSSKIKYDECLEFLEPVLNLSKKLVIVTYPFFDAKSETNRNIFPLSHYSITDANEWNRSYQSIKHDRLKEYKKGNMKCALHSLAALYLLNLYLKDESFKIKHREIHTFDTRFGSTLFSIEKPSDMTKLVSNPFISECSVYEYELTDESRKEYERRFKDYMDKFFSFLKTVPELHESDFANKIQDLSAKHSGITFALNFFNELSKYRIDKSFAGLKKEEKIALLQSKLNNGVAVNDENFDECYFNLILNEQTKFITQFPPLIYQYLFNDSMILVHISKAKQEENKN